MFEENKAEKATIITGISVVSAGCFMVHPVLGCVVLGIAISVFGIVCWIIANDKIKRENRGRY